MGAREGERGACEDEGDLGKNAPSRSPVFHCSGTGQIY